MVAELVVAAPAFGLDREIGRLLNLKKQTACADSVNHFCRNIDNVAGLYLKGLKKLLHNGLAVFALLNGFAELFHRHAVLEAVKDLSAGTGCKDIPALLLAVGGVEILA